MRCRRCPLFGASSSGDVIAVAAISPDMLLFACRCRVFAMRDFRHALFEADFRQRRRHAPRRRYARKLPPPDASELSQPDFHARRLRRRIFLFF